MAEFSLMILASVFIYVLFFYKKKKKKYERLPDNFQKILNSHVRFYTNLSHEEKLQFEERILHFLNTTKITGIDTTVEQVDEVLVASSAIIPVFAFPDWEYVNLNEVLLYPSGFNERFETDGGNIQGMVGNGYMEGKMILSKPALHLGFKNETDKQNVGIHEFTHLIDKADGAIDGIPSALLDKQYSIPWLDLIKRKMEEIHALKSDINPYGGVEESEFFPVITEYFFERPRLLKSQHPELYDYLREIFTVDLSKKYKGKILTGEINRNDLCPCGSRKKYKHCCLVS